MRDRVIATRYAEAFIAFAMPKIGLPRIIEDIREMRSLLRENPDFETFLRIPDVPRSEKFRVLDRVTSELLSAETRDFIKYLITKGRVDKIHSIMEYIRVVYSHGEVIDALLRSTFPLELDVVNAIKGKLEKRLAKKVNLYLELNPDLLGGVQMVVGNKIIDGSVRHKLQELRKQLLKVQVVR